MDGKETHVKYFLVENNADRYEAPKNMNFFRVHRPLCDINLKLIKNRFEPLGSFRFFFKTLLPGTKAAEEYVWEEVDDEQKMPLPDFGGELVVKALRLEDKLRVAGVAAPAAGARAAAGGTPELRRSLSPGASSVRTPRSARSPASSYSPEELAMFEELEKTSHFNQREIKMMYQKFRKEAPDLQIDRAGFALVTEGMGIKEKFLQEAIFNKFDTDRSGAIDFKEFVTGMSVMTRGSAEEKLEAAFRMYDLDGSGSISLDEFLKIMESFKHLQGGEVHIRGKKYTDITQLCTDMFKSIDADSSGEITLEEYKNAYSPALDSLGIPQLWSQWKQQNNRAYTPAEEAQRVAVFEQNVREVRRLSAAMPSTEFGLTKYADLTKEEFAKIYLNANVPDGLSKLEGLIRKSTLSPVPVAGLPSNWIAPTVTPVRDQGQCGSCWAFATTAVMESAWFKSTGNMTQFSTQQIVDCDTYSFGCGGGSAFTPYKYIISLTEQGAGFETEEDYPYTASDQSQCNYSADKAVGKFSHMFWVGFDEDRIDSELVRSGPLSFGLDATTLQLYVSGVLEDTPQCMNYQDQANHIVVLIGWGVDASGRYWVVKNSWGADWGEKGWFRIRRGAGTCLIASGQAFGVTVDACVPKKPACKQECGYEWDGCSRYVKCGDCKQEGWTCGVNHTCIKDFFDGPNLKPDLDAITKVSPSFPYAFFKFETRVGMVVDFQGMRPESCTLDFSFLPRFGAPWLYRKSMSANYLGYWNYTYHWYTTIPMSSDNMFLEATAWCNYEGDGQNYYLGHNGTTRYVRFQYDSSASSDAIRTISDDTGTIGVAQGVSASEAAKIAVTVQGNDLSGVQCAVAYSVLDHFGEEWADVHEVGMQGEQESWYLAVAMPAAGHVLEAKVGCQSRTGGKVWTNEKYLFQSL
eukprot:m51a1_g9411 hypothetical protein (915) ;mRNA; r:336243-342515